MMNSEFLNIVLKYCIKEYYIVIRKFAQVIIWWRPTSSWGVSSFV